MDYVVYKNKNYNINNQDQVEKLQQQLATDGVLNPNMTYLGGFRYFYRQSI